MPWGCQLPLVADMSVCTLQHTFTHAKGRLFASQFVQIALTTTPRPAFEDIRSKGLVQPDARLRWPNTLSRTQKDFFSPLNSCRLSLLLRPAPPSKTCARKVWCSLTPAFADHSLGECSPLAAVVDIAFYRGLAMQNIIQHDEQFTRAMPRVFKSTILCGLVLSPSPPLTIITPSTSLSPTIRPSPVSCTPSPLMVHPSAPA
jgi:hypothetical protein